MSRENKDPVILERGQEVIMQHESDILELSHNRNILILKCATRETFWLKSRQMIQNHQSNQRCK